MDSIPINCLSGSYNVLVGSKIEDALFEIVGNRRALIVTDNKVNSLYSQRLEMILPQAEVFVIKQGEKSKNEKTLFDLLEFMLESDYDRQSVLVAFGGGVVGDLSGFAASIFMRGIDYIQVPTTLLSQIDSAIGGKTAINLLKVKNAIGSFYQPQAVLIDTQYLKTLDEEDILSGVGEIIKTACLSKEFFSYVEENLEKIFALSPEILEETIARCIEIKRDIVEQDEEEKSGLRKKLNLGHTIGHAMEMNTFFNAKSHGEHVLNGIFFETELAFQIRRLSKEDKDRIQNLIKKALKYIPKITDGNKLVGACLKDKKNMDGNISMIIPTDIGEVDEIYIDEGELEEYLEKFEDMDI